MHDTNCPYCNEGIDINHDDGYGFEEDQVCEQECKHCLKNFTYTTSIIYHYNTEKAPCLNGEDHKYKMTRTAPKCFTKMCCEYCDTSRPLTRRERVTNNIPTVSAYLEKFKTAS